MSDLVVTRDGGVLRLHVDREPKRNALNGEVLKGILDALRDERFERYNRYYADLTAQPGFQARWDEVSVACRFYGTRSVTDVEHELLTCRASR